jgi:hypothetical protein
MAPAMREWVGGRQAKGFRENGITIVNKRYEATLEVLLDEMRRDKTGQVMVRVAELAQRTNAHWAKLLSTLLIAGESAVCYDGQFFFDTDHAEGDSGAQDNDLSVDIAVTSAPTAGEMEGAILRLTQQILGFKDDQGEPMNEEARSFLVMVPVNMMRPLTVGFASSLWIRWYTCCGVSPFSSATCCTIIVGCAPFTPFASRFARAFATGIFTVSASFSTVISSACGTGGSLDAVDQEFLISSPTSMTVPNGGMPVIDTDERSVIARHVSYVDKGGAS